jgi:hypothetical protein
MSDTSNTTTTAPAAPPAPVDVPKEGAGNGAALTALLEMAESQLNEGDFLKVANFLKTMHEPDRPTPSHIKSVKPVSMVHFNLSDCCNVKKRFHLKVEEYVTHYFPGSTPNKHFVRYVMNDDSCKTVPVERFWNMMNCFVNVIGMNNIQITLAEFGVVIKFASWADFTGHVHSLYYKREAKENLARGYEDEDNIDYIADETYFRHLLGISMY